MKYWGLILCIVSLGGQLSAARMVVFGDSLSDGGYWFGARQIDSGGEFWHENLADRLGFTRATTSGLLGSSGLNLAVATNRVENLQDQVDRYSNRYTWQTGDLCTLWIGGNDLRDDPNQNMTTLASEIGDIISQLAALGVDHFIVPNLPDLGAIPESLGDTPLMTARRAGTIAFNTALAAELNIRSTNLSVTIHQLDIFSLFDHMLDYASDFGFSNTTEAQNAQSSGTPDDYVFWDDIHPTSRSHYLVSASAQALVDENAPIEVISWSINPNGSFRQTWIADPSAPYEVLSGPQVDQLTTVTPFIGNPVYTTVISAPSNSSGFFKTQKN
ncbi:MAG: SGNH/GDSL hydrolase family protein [Opitutaceae bacterium]